MKWTLVGLLAVVVSAGIVAGCSGGKFSDRSSEGQGKTLRYPIPELTELDPALVQDGDTIDVLQQVFEGLTTWSEKSEPVPNLAERWEISKDGLTYTFFLKKGIKFHNGREVTADDFKYSLERVTNPELKSPTASTYLDAIDGFADKFSGKAKELRGVKVVDASTLQIKIDKPRPYFLGRLTYPASFVVCKEALDNGGKISNVKQMVGTGPFRAENYTPDQLISMAANADYHGGAPKLERIERPIIKDAQARLNKFRSGEVELTRVERSDIAGIKEDAKLQSQLRFFDRPSMYYVGLNGNGYAPFKDVRVRQAFAMAINRQKIVDETLGGINKLANSIIPPGLPAYRDDAPAHPFDPERARKLLADAGFPGGKGLPTLTLTHRDGQPDVQVVAENVVTQLRENLGVEAKTQKLPWITYLERHNTRTIGFLHMRWGADYPDPENFLSTLLSSYGNENKIGYSNPKYDALCLKADTMIGNDAERWRLYQQAEDIALSEAPFIPVYYQKDAELISPRVKGMRESVFGHLPHTTTSLE